MTSLRAYGAGLDRAAEAQPTTAPVAELVTPPLRPQLPRRSMLAAAAIVAVVAAGAGVLVARDRDERRPHIGTRPSSSVPVPPSSTTNEPKPSAAPAVKYVEATATGVLEFDASGKAHRVVEGAVITAVSDTKGGVVFQRGDRDATLWHLPADASEPVAVARATGTDWLELWDVTVTSGDAVVVYSRHSLPTPTDEFTSETLLVTSLATGHTRTIGKVGGGEAGPAAISAGGGRFALYTGAETLALFEFLDQNATVVRVPGNPFDDAARYPDGHCLDDPICPHTIAIAADGKQFAYIEPVPGTPRDYRFVARDYQVVVVDTTTGAKVATVAVHFPTGDPHFGIGVYSLDLTDDGTVIVNYDNSDAPRSEKPLVVDIATGEVSALPVAGTAREG